MRSTPPICAVCSNRCRKACRRTWARAAPCSRAAKASACAWRAQLELVNLSQWAERKVGDLSGGMQQRVGLARALMQSDTRLILLDEPFRGLDRGQRSRLLTEARQWWRGRTMLCVTHDVSETQEFDRVLVIEDGVVIEDGAPALLAGGRTRYRELLDAETQVRDQM